MDKKQSSPLLIYQHEIAAGQLIPDRGQFKTIRLLDKLFETIVCDDHNSPWYKRFLGSNQPKIKGCYIWGGVGTGKTMIMDLFFQALPAGTGERIHFHKFMQHVHDEKNKIIDKQNPLRIITTEFASRFRILCLDEFSVTDITDAMILDGLLQHMFENGITLVTTSNTPPDDLYKDGLQRSRFVPAIELLKNNNVVVNLDSGTDYRMDYLRDDAIFHIPLGSESETALENCFNRLAGRVRLNTSTISIAGRDVPVKAVGDRVVWFEFDALCRTNRSKLDYISIAKEYHTVIVSNLVQLDDVDNNPARRLIEMIDEFYDRNVNLIVSSAVPPDEVYTGKRLSEPFKRTASRLNEMSTNQYLSQPHLG